MPFDATVDGVRALIPEASLPEVLPPGGRGVTAEQVRLWLEELSGRVDLRLRGWRRLRADPTPAELEEGLPAPRWRFADTARTVVHNGAAAYVEAARFPERAGAGDTSYAGVLWARYVEGLAELEGYLAAELALVPGGEDGAVVDSETDGRGISFAFPAASFTPAHLRF